MDDVMRQNTINMIALLIIVFAMTAGRIQPLCCSQEEDSQVSCCS